jgi:flagellar motor switch protein FliM
MSAAISTDIRSKLLDSGGLQIDKLPMLQMIFERMATMCADGVRPLTSSQAHLQLSKVEARRIGGALEEYEGKAIVAVFQAPAWDSPVLIGVDRGFIFTMIDLLFGADGSEPPVDDQRDYSALEMRLALTLLERAARALQASLAPISAVQLKFERLETRTDFTPSGQCNDRAVAAKFQLRALDRGGEMFVIIPQAALAPMREALSRAISGESGAGDPAWARQIRSEVRKTTVSLRAVLEERTITLGEASNFKIGQVLQLQATPASRIKLEGSEQPLFWCNLGQGDGGVYNLRIEDPFDHEQEFLNDILAR